MECFDCGKKIDEAIYEDSGGENICLDCFLKEEKPKKKGVKKICLQ